MCRLMKVPILHIEYNHRFYLTIKDAERIIMRSEQTLTKVAKRLETSTNRIRLLCKELNIEIKKDGYLNYIETEDIDRLEMEVINRKQNYLSNETLKERIELARQAKLVACGGDILTSLD